VRADDAADALERLRQGRIDLVFSDIVMPGQMDGIALAKEIKARYPHTPVLLTSGYSEMAQAAEREFQILRKPFQLAALAQVVGDALRHRGATAGSSRS
jgi:DNA-binding NtrC family response regulator